MFVVRLSPREVEEGGCEVGGGRRETGVIYMTLVDNWRDMTELGQGQRARALGWEGARTGTDRRVGHSIGHRSSVSALFRHTLARHTLPIPGPSSATTPAPPPRPALPLASHPAAPCQATTTVDSYYRIFHREHSTLRPDRLARRPSLRVFD